MPQLTFKSRLFLHDAREQYFVLLLRPVKHVFKWYNRNTLPDL